MLLMPALSLRPVALALALAACAGLGAAPAAAQPAAPQAARAAINPPSKNVAWLPAANDADIERAFAQARREGKPVLLYWGATWCPPCNQLKATFFNRQDFAARSRSFVAVHVDGDRPGAQKLGKRFQVSGYPTVVLFGPDGSEITRLPGEVDPEQMMTVLQLGLSGGRPVKAVLGDARAGKTLTSNEWRLLAFYSWETDEAQVVPRGELPTVLAQLATQVPASEGETATRLWLKALAASNDGKGLKPDAAARERLTRLLGDAALSRLHMDVLTNFTRPLVRAFGGDEDPARAALVTAFDASLQRLQGDTTLSRSDRLGTLIARVHLARLGQPAEAVQVQLPAPLLESVRTAVAREDREITDGYERQAVITAGAYLLGLAGLWSESDALLQSNLARSHSSYYLMSQLGSNARKLGRNEEALRWYQQAWEKSQGPATRLQWGFSYLSATVDLAPTDAARIERTASTLIREAAADRGAFEGRSLRSLQRMSTRLLSWNEGGRHAATLQRLQRQLGAVCAKTDAASGQKAACEALLKPAPTKA
jgi:thiol-disulfide isomerase/thioredoxin